MLNDWLTESTDLDSTDAFSRSRHADQPNRRLTQNRTLSPPQKPSSTSAKSNCCNERLVAVSLLATSSALHS